MRLGFLGGAFFSAWLTLSYPAEVATVFEKITTAAQQIFSSTTTSESQENHK